MGLFLYESESVHGKMALLISACDSSYSKIHSVIHSVSHLTLAGEGRSSWNRLQLGLKRKLTSFTWLWIQHDALFFTVIYLPNPGCEVGGDCQLFPVWLLKISQSICEFSGSSCRALFTLATRLLLQFVRVPPSAATGFLFIPPKYNGLLLSSTYGGVKHQAVSEQGATI